ncbi:MAG: alpha/beta hydrolase-fold protein [Ferruginibacter sp.]
MRLIFLTGFLFVIILPTQFCASQGLNSDSGTTSFTLTSKILGEQNKVLINLPDDYNKSTEKYPVVYVLDGEYNFSFTSEAVKTLYQSERMPPCIVVGINSSNRERDFTPAGDKNWHPPVEMRGAGGADKFLDYLEKELVPYVNNNLRTQPYRVIIGHSLGGLLAMYSLSAKPDLFQAYIGLESSLWWNDGAVGKSIMNYFTAHQAYKGKLFWCRVKMPREVWFPINITLADYFEKKHPRGLEYKYMEIDNETHSTMVFPATYFGLRDIFADYFFKLDEKANENSILSYYDALSKKYGYPITIPQQIYNFLWDIEMNSKNYKKAITYGELRIKFYPNSYRAYLDLGNTYRQMGNNEMAIKMLTVALNLNPKDEAVKELLNSISNK